MNRRGFLQRWLRHPWKSWEDRRVRRLRAFLYRMEAVFARDYLKANGIEDPDEFLRQLSESTIGPEHIEIVGREKNELLDDLVFKAAPDGPLKIDIKTTLPTVTWRKA